MSKPTNIPTPSVDASRRSLLIATLLGSVTAGTGLLSHLIAAEPPRIGVLLRVGGQQLVRSTNLKTIRLKPVTASFEGTVIQAIAADPRGKLIAVAGDDHSIRIMDITTLAVLQRLNGHSDMIQTVQFDPSGNRLASAGNDGQLLVWDRNADFKLSQRIRNAPSLASVRFSPDGKEIAAVGFDNQVYLIGTSRQAGRPKVECDCTDLRAVAYRSDGQVLAVAGRSGNLHLFDRSTNESQGDFQLHSGRVHALEFVGESPVIASVGEDGMVVIFDTQSKEITGKIKVPRCKLFAVCILDREHVAVAGSNNVISIVNVKLGVIVESLQGHTGSITSLACNGSQLFSGGYDTTLCRWHLTGIHGDPDRIAERDTSLGR